MGRVKDYFHDEICSGASDMGEEPDYIERLSDERDLAYKNWSSLIDTFPPWHRRSKEQVAEIVQARIDALAARDRFLDAGGK